jgi:hypothetical protein
MRFTLKELLIFVTLISIGLGAALAIGALVRADWPNDKHHHPFSPIVAIAAMVILWFGSGAAFGAAIGMCFRRPGTVVAIVWLIQLIAGCYLLMIPVVY